MRVLAFCDYFLPDSCGGSERVAREVYQRLSAEHGVEMTVVGAIPAAGGDGRIRREHRDGVDAVLVPAHDLSAKLGVQLLASRRLPHVAAALVRELAPDVLHANSLHFEGTLVAAALARRHRIPLVTTAHLAGGEALAPGLRFAAAGWDHTLGRAAVTASTGVVAVSEAVAAHVRTLGLGRRHLTLARNGVDHGVFHAVGRETPGGPLRVGFVGRLITNKGPDVFLRGAAHAVADGADICVSVVGDGPMRAELEQFAAQGTLRGRVEFTGQVTDVAQRMRRLDVVVRSSFTEGLPLAVVEAMASGAVVLASGVPGNLELISHLRSGLVFPAGDDDALGRALRLLADDRALLRRLQGAALEQAQLYSWTDSAQRHFEALTRASGPARTAATDMARCA